ncbi:MAG: hypothetical protein PHR28_07785 [candidate division Zixibacteria bacterium]|nr:hypothetical protein [candidate division Zixibacteria bacterium]
MIKRLKQGDIIRKVEYIYSATVEDNILNVRKIIFPLVIVLTQDCDLESYTGRIVDVPPSAKAGLLLSVLVAPVYNADHLRSGVHLSELKIAVDRIVSDEWTKIRKNENKRYHYFIFPSDLHLIPEAVVDFKHYFSVPVNYLQAIREKGHICTLPPLYRESFSQRFAAFLSRIALPERHPPLKLFQDMKDESIAVDNPGRSVDN